MLAGMQARGLKDAVEEWFPGGQLDLAALGAFVDRCDDAPLRGAVAGLRDVLEAPAGEEVDKVSGRRRWPGWVGGWVGGR